MRAMVLALCALCLAPFGVSALGGAESPDVATFDYDDVSRVVVEDAQVYTIEVSGQAGRGLMAEVLSPRDSRVGIEHRRSGGTVTIRAYNKGGARWLIGTRGPHLLVLRVPRDTVLDLKTSTGTIRVTDVDGEKRLATDTGRIELKGSRGNVEARTDTGSHTYIDIEGDITAHSGTGGMTLEGADGVFVLDTDTGSIEAVDTILRGDSRFGSDTGSITLDLDQWLEGMSFDLRTDTGTVSVNDVRERGRLVIEGGSPRVSAQTDTGSIRVRGR